MKNSIQNGRTMEYTPSKDIEGGSIVTFADMVGVAITDIAQNTTGALETEGVFELSKDNTALAQGQNAYVKKDGTLTATASDNILAGKCWQEASKEAGTVAIKINV